VALIDLPPVEYVSEDVTQTLNNLVAVYQGLTERTLYPADPVRLFLQSIAVIIVQQRTLINLTGRANLLRYAPTAVLDHMGAFTETPRLQATPATTTVRFTLSAPQLSAVSIPAGTRVSTQGDPKRYFATAQYAEITAGNLTVDASANCTELGAAGNGYLAGQINQIVDPIAFVASAANLTTSAGGSDVEGDDAYRERIHTAPEAFSVAGPSGAYEHLAKTAAPDIIDVSVTSPAACEVLVVPLLKDGVIPGTEVLQAVEDILNDRTKRPLTDQVTVAAPTSMSYNVTLTYWIKAEDGPDATAIQAAVTAAVSDFILWQKSKMGRSINPSELIRRVMVAGAYRVNVLSPTFTAIGPTEIAVAGTVSATYGGLVDD
jgi:phage-related baseplate assembly protein